MNRAALFLSSLALLGLAVPSACAPAAKPDITPDGPNNTSTPQSTPTGTPAVPPSATPTSSSMVKAIAPIERIEIAVAESFPPQYFLHVTYGLPNGCARPGGHESVSRKDTLIEVAVYYLKPADPNAICTMIYGTATDNINLGSDFTSGATYTVVVNDKKTQFTAQ